MCRCRVVHTRICALYVESDSGIKAERALFVAVHATWPQVQLEPTERKQELMSLKN